MEPLELKGLWWISSNPKDELPGTLFFDPAKGISLDLLGHFGDIQGFGSGLREYDVILGFSKDGKKVTLFDCTAMFSMRMPGMTSLDVRVGKALIGDHFESFNDVYFSEVDLGYDYLSDWLQLSGLQWSFQVNDKNEFMKYTFEYALPEEVIVDLPEDSALSVNFSFSFRPSSFEVTGSQAATLRIKSGKPLNIKGWFARYVIPLQNFLTLAVDVPCAIRSVEFMVPWVEENDDLEDKIEEDNGRSRKRKISYLFQPIYSPEKPSKPLRNEDMLFTYKDISSDFPKLLNVWMKVAEELQVVCGIYFGTRYRSSSYQEARFLSIVQAVEIYHRIRYPNTVIPKEEFKARLNEIINNTSEQYKTWLREQLTYSNEPRLIQRMKELFELTKDVMEVIVVTEEDFPRKVTDTRNYYTHYNSRLSNKAAKGEALLWLTEKLSMLIQRCLLHELRFSSEKCASLFLNNKRYQAIKRYGLSSNLY